MPIPYNDILIPARVPEYIPELPVTPAAALEQLRKQAPDVEQYGGTISGSGFGDSHDAVNAYRAEMNKNFYQPQMENYQNYYNDLSNRINAYNEALMQHNANVYATSSDIRPYDPSRGTLFGVISTLESPMPLPEYAPARNVMRPEDLTPGQGASVAYSSYGAARRGDGGGGSREPVRKAEITGPSFELVKDENGEIIGAKLGERNIDYTVGASPQYQHPYTELFKKKSVDKSWFPIDTIRALEESIKARESYLNGSAIDARLKIFDYINKNLPKGNKLLINKYGRVDSRSQVNLPAIYNVITKNIDNLNKFFEPGLRRSIVEYNDKPAAKRWWNDYITEEILRAHLLSN